jgi:hypothetical protein
MLAAMITESKEKCAKINDIYNHLIEEHTTTVKAYYEQGNDIEIQELLSKMPAHIAILLNFRVAAVC